MKISIKYKFLIGYFTVFFIALMSLNLLAQNIVYKNTEEIIKKDMEELYKSSRNYLKQFFVVKELTENSDSFEKNKELIGMELLKTYDVGVSLYDTNGNQLEVYDNQNHNLVAFNKNNSIDLKDISNYDLDLAIKNKAALRTNYVNNKLIANFSYPFHIKENNLGILRFSKDYTYISESNERFLSIFTYVTVLLFLILFIFSYILSLNITRPLLKLSKGLKEVSKGNYDVDINIKNKDEVGELGKNFNIMKEKIESQMNTITKEKEKVLKLQQSRTEFFNNVTHELKTPLTTISGYAQIMSQKDFDDLEFLNRASSKIKEESDRLHRMVVDLIEVSKTSTYEDKLSFTKVNLKELLYSICTDMNIKANKYKMNIKYDINNNLFVSGDENKLKEVFINVLDNAIKYGRVKTDIYVKPIIKNKYIEIEIENKSDDIPNDKIDKVFEPFYRLKGKENKEKGSNGLGLYICRNIMRQHSGDINLESKDGTVKVIIKIPSWQQFGNIS
ncbi:sensor signal transduction histidine kinase [Gottschalkia purinilytica]|uniref:histidine kinase n=1 Tax=Gottschalkia purinilytica TaxID=1503 RepID=A0A0L0WCM4_GOTPU|nr:HAMP domain-containing sensor histidine kinase [Gottschalkia purinilytica]KNF09217.1 sensor signal transduction histidine kinase [Gottschalkia purinilytica]